MTNEMPARTFINAFGILFGAMFLGMAAQFLIAPEQRAWGLYEIVGIAAGVIGATTYAVIVFRGAKPDRDPR
ncbi:MULTISPECIES: hypothetical protein [unclassified Microbacterium]|uniref:hypothetical protein n=1 Tax=unclassified Microbacterium TaxID=2609290 RepID=UPI00109C9D62|nr:MULTISPECIES: hypothetical protein [unclassified Microbacterium]